MKTYECSLRPSFYPSFSHSIFVFFTYLTNGNIDMLLIKIFTDNISHIFFIMKLPY
jgi:hypothetical protein